MADYRDCPERTCHSKSLSRAYDGIAYPTFPSKCWMLMSTFHGGLLRSGRIALGNLKKILRLPDPAYTKCIFPQLTSKFYYSNLSTHEMAAGAIHWPGPHSSQPHRGKAVCSFLLPLPLRLLFTLLRSTSTGCPLSARCNPQVRPHASQSYVSRSGPTSNASTKLQPMPRIIGWPTGIPTEPERSPAEHHA